MRRAILVGYIWGFCGACLAADLYVAPGGNDGNPGTQDRPLLSLERARDTARELRKQQPSAAITVWIAAGRYDRRQSLELAQEDSGTRAAPLVWRSIPGQQARLIAGRLVPPEALQPVRDAAVLNRLEPAAKGKLLQADLSALGVDDLGQVPPNGKRAELFFNGRPLVLARWPNEDFVRIASVIGGKPIKVHGISGDAVGKFTYEGDRPARWAGQQDVWLQGYWFWDWADAYQRVESIDPQARSITLAAPYHHYGYRKGQRFYAENVLAELDTPGEWYVDRRSKTLYLWPPEPIEKAEVLFSVLEQPLVVLRETSHVEIRDLVLEAGRGDGAHVIGGQGNRVAGCTIRNLGGGGVVIRGGTGNSADGCEIYQVGAGGVNLSGGDRKTLTPAGNSAVNNHIHHYARLRRTYAAAIQLDGVGNRAAGNLVHHAPHMAIGFGGNENVMELNEIHDVCQETGDVGVFYTGRDWTVRGNVIRHNFIHDVSGPGLYGAQGIYLDDCASGTVVFGNVLSKVARAMLIGGGRDNTIENNLMVDCGQSIRFDNRGLNWMRYHVEGNGIMPQRLAALPYRQPPWSERYPQLLTLLADNPGAPKGNIVRWNVVCRSKPMHLAKEVTQFGTVAENLTLDGDPGFRDAAKMDFRLRDDSQVFQKLPKFQQVRLGALGAKPDAKQ